MAKKLMLSPKIWNKARMATVTISIQLCTEHPSQVNRQEKEIKVMQIVKKEIKLSLFMGIPWRSNG